MVVEGKSLPAYVSILYQITGLVINYGISNTNVLEIP